MQQKNIQQILAVGHTLVNWHLGAAINAIPHQFKELGIFPSLLGLLVSGVMTFLVIMLLVNSAVKCKVYSFSGLVSTVFGPIGGIVLSMLVVLNAIGVFAAYFGILQVKKLVSYFYMSVLFV